MGDLSWHLEKMGTKLKCPICLGLLKSAVSIASSHVFCNSCILESMKSGSDCPICEGPFHRREVLPASHIDNLVNIFKGMEVKKQEPTCLPLKWHHQPNMQVIEPVDEKFEIGIDVHGISGGPSLGRLRVLNIQPKLFSGFRFYFSGDFTPPCKGYVQDIVIAAGGAILQRETISRDHKLLDDLSLCTTFIIHSIEPPEKHNKVHGDNVFKCRQIEAQLVTDASGAK